MIRAGGSVADKDQWLTRALGLSVPAAADSAGEADGLDADSLKEWLDDLVAQASVLPEPARTGMLAQAKAARAGLAAGDTRASTAAALQLATDIANATRTARRRDAAPVSSGRANVGRLRTQWRMAELTAHSALEAFVGQMLADPKVKQAPAYADLEAAAGAFADLFPDFGFALEDALDDLEAAEDDHGRAEARRHALLALDGYEADLAGADGLRDLQALAQADYGSGGFVDVLQAAFAALRGELSRAI